MAKLPKILKREPLVDAVFEVRLSSTTPLADILPGYMLREFAPKPTITRLPAAELPHPVRSGDKQLRYAPIQRLDLGQYQFLVGDQNFVLGCKLPYPKWPAFKLKILDVVRRVAGVGIDNQVERYSLKYVNLIPSEGYAEQLKKIRISLQLGDIEVTDDHISVQLHRKEGGMVHIMSIVTGASRQAMGKAQNGVVVDIDSIQHIQPRPFHSFAADLEPALEKLRQENKAKFFSCLTEETINELEPLYE